MRATTGAGSTSSPCSRLHSQTAQSSGASKGTRTSSPVSGTITTMVSSSAASSSLRSRPRRLPTVRPHQAPKIGKIPAKGELPGPVVEGLGFLVVDEPKTGGLHLLPVPNLGERGGVVRHGPAVPGARHGPVARYHERGRVFGADDVLVPQLVRGGGVPSHALEQLPALFPGELPEEPLVLLLGSLAGHGQALLAILRGLRGAVRPGFGLQLYQPPLHAHPAFLPCSVASSSSRRSTSSSCSRAVSPSLTHALAPLRSWPATALAARSTSPTRTMSASSSNRLCSRASSAVGRPRPPLLPAHVLAPAHEGRGFLVAVADHPPRRGAHTHAGLQPPREVADPARPYRLELALA